MLSLEWNVPSNIVRIYGKNKAETIGTITQTICDKNVSFNDIHQIFI